MSRTIEAPRRTASARRGADGNEAHGVCIELLPELIERDPWGFPVVADRSVPDRLLAHARRAVENCPTLARLLVDAESARRR